MPNTTKLSKPSRQPGSLQELNRRDFLHVGFAEVPGMGTDDLVDDSHAAVLVAVEDLLGRNVTVDVVAILEIEKSMRLSCTRDLQS